MKKTCFPLLLSMCAVTACGPGLSGDSHSRREPYTFVSIPKSDFSRDFVKRTHFIVDSDRHPTLMFGYLSASAYEKLDPALKPRVSELDPIAFAHGETRVKELSQALAPFSGRELRLDSSSVEPYHTHETLTDELETLVATNPQIFSLSSLGKTVQGRDIWVVKVSDNPKADEDEPKILYVSTMHGNEVVGQEMSIYLLRLIAREYDTSARIRSIVDNGQLYVIPNLNPDGTAARTRFNADSVDLNRDFPDFLEDPHDVPGNRAPETKAMMEFLQHHLMQTTLSFHGGAACINLPWDTIPNDASEKRFGDTELLVKLAHQYAETNVRMTKENSGNFDRGVTFGWEWYETHGNMADWAAYYRGSAASTIELSEVKWPPAAELPQFWQENREPLLAYLESSLTGLALDVKGPAGERPDVRVSHDATRRTLVFNGGTGFRTTLPGTRRVRIEADGYAPLELDLPAERFQGTHFPVTLQRAAAR